MKTLKDLKKLLKNDISGLPKVRMAVLGDMATQFLTEAIKGWCAENGYFADIFEAPFNQVEQQCINPVSELHSFSAQFIVLAQTTHKLNEKYSLCDTTEYAKLADERLRFVGMVCNTFKNATIICMNYPEIDDGVFGSYANKVSSSFIYQVRKLNLGLMELSETNANLLVCDIASIQNKFGRDSIYDSTVYASTEMTISVNYIPLVAKRIVDIVMANKGREKKCIILDLDNTLWGGVVGDYGVSGIELGHGLGIGKMFVEFQQWLLKLKKRGLILCVCSKNNEETAKEPFLTHPDMVLKLDDIAVFLANWDNKVVNIKKIQRILNIGFDSMVFLDDNAFEREIVKENIPEITVPELPNDPAMYLEYLYSLNMFETASYISTDLDRTKQYKEKAEREQSNNSFDNEDDFLKSLNMQSKVEEFSEYNVPRIAQLSQRSNQFNLRTIRYTEFEINSIAVSNHYMGRTFTLLDKFGDNGLISVVIMKKQEDSTLFIETWFMSCRVLNRGVENFVMNTIVQIAKEHGYKKIVGEYIPTKKNILVKNLYNTLGFEPTSSDIGSERYVLDIEKYLARPCFIEEKE